MRSVARTVYLVVAVAFVVGLAAQVFLAGLGVFDSPTAFATHRDVGYALSFLPILLLILGLVGGLGRRMAILAAVIFGLFLLQSVFVAMRDSSPAIAALHPVNGFLIVLLAIFVAREGWLAREAGTA
jgi:putative tricarboxylic transport membrane protein